MHQARLHDKVSYLVGWPKSWLGITMRCGNNDKPYQLVIIIHNLNQTYKSQAKYNCYLP